MPVESPPAKIDPRTKKLNDALARIDELEAEKKAGWPVDVKIAYAERDQARDVAIGLKNERDQALAKIEELESGARAAPMAHLEMGGGPAMPSLEPLTWKKAATADRPGEPGMVSFGFLKEPGRVVVRHRLSFADWNGFSVDEIVGNAETFARNSVDPNVVMLGRIPNFLDVVDGQPLALGQFSRNGYMQITMECINPDEYEFEEESNVS